MRDRSEALPTTRAEQRRWTRDIRQLLPHWVQTKVRPVIAQALSADGLAADLRIDGDRLFIDYRPGTTGTGYVTPSVMLEFGARSTGLPASVRSIVCDASEFIDGLAFPTAAPRVMHAERTFWEKATAIHVFCRQGRLRGERFARHWHDVVRLDEAGFADKAMADRALANAVARHKTMFFEEKAFDGSPVDYSRAVNGALRLAPEGAGTAVLSDDYVRMVDDGLLFETAETFEDLIEKCRALEARANDAIR